MDAHAGAEGSVRSRCAEVVGAGGDGAVVVRLQLEEVALFDAAPRRAGERTAVAVAGVAVVALFTRVERAVAAQLFELTRRAASVIRAAVAVIALLARGHDAVA